MIAIKDVFKPRIRMALISTIAAAIAIAVSPAASRAQSLAPDTYAVNYYSLNVAAAPDATVRIINPTGSLRCANLYVFDARQNLQECCSCGITSNGLLTLSVRNQLTANPLSGVVPVTGAIKLLSTSPAVNNGAQVCDISQPPLPTPALRAWATHVQLASPPQKIQLTEEEFADSPLDQLEYGKLLDQCILAVSKRSVCNCGSASTIP